MITFSATRRTIAAADPRISTTTACDCGDSRRKSASMAESCTAYCTHGPLLTSRPVIQSERCMLVGNKGDCHSRGMAISGGGQHARQAQRSPPACSSALNATR